MNLILLHGEGLVAKLNRISQIKLKFNNLEITELSGRDLNWGQILTALSTEGLFSERRLVIVEGLDSSVSLSNLSDIDNLSLVLSFGKRLPESSNVIKSAKEKKAQIIFFPEDKEISVFPFLDYLAEKNLKAFKEMDELFSEYGGQYLLTMIYYMLRRFILNPRNLPSFALKKLRVQKNNFSDLRVRYFYELTLNTEFKIKKGLLDEKNGLFQLTERFINY